MMIALKGPCATVTAATVHWYVE